MQYGLIGEHLAHSYSKEIHEKISDCSYELREVKPEELGAFMKAADFKGINVTIPYKEAVIPYLDEVSQQAREIGAVNTIVNRDGRLTGYNTDYFGLRDLIRLTGIDAGGRKVLILGTGGTSRTAFAVVKDLGAREIYKVSRSGKDGALTYKEACRKHPDADIIINTTPCGMFPKSGDCPLEPARFPDLKGVVDVIYNPLRTNLVQKAQDMGIPASGGLYMLVAQAVYAAELFYGIPCEKERIDAIYMEILNEVRNIVLTGMSLAGKTTVGGLLAKALHKKMVDTDQEIIARENRSINEIFATDGEGYFRDVESLVVRSLGERKGLIIATGGGAILREENVNALRQNGVILFLDRPIRQILPTADRPLANTTDKVIALHSARYPIYCGTCDIRVPNQNSAEEVTKEILSLLKTHVFI